MVEYFEVIRSFEAKGTILKQGDIIDGYGFRLKSQLVEQRFMRPFYGDSLVEAKQESETTVSVPVIARRRGRPRKQAQATPEATNA